LPPLPEEVRATVLVIWLEVISGHVDLSTLRELCQESLTRPEGNSGDAIMLDIIDQLIACSEGSCTSPPPFSARYHRCGYRPDSRLGARIRSRRDVM
jgi:hypothetical protein